MIENILEDLSVKFEKFDSIAAGGLTFDWVIVVLIEKQKDIEKYKKFIEEVYKNPEELKGGLITFKVV